MINITAICGSTRNKSVNNDILEFIKSKSAGRYELNIFKGIDQLPHFNQDLDNEHPPESVIAFRQMIEQTDGLLISTPEYVFSIPGVLKNAIEWLVSTTVLSGKPVAIITASTAGEKAHESLTLIIKTLYTNISEKTCLLISGAKSKVNKEGKIIDKKTEKDILYLIDNFCEVIEKI